MRDGGEWGILLEVGETVPVRVHTTGRTYTLTVVDEQPYDPSAGAYEHGWWCRNTVSRYWWFVSQSGRADMHHGDGDDDEPGGCFDFGFGEAIRVPERGRT